MAAALDVTTSALMSFLSREDAILYGKALELRERVENWLSLVPVTFPTYTRHTVLHSDEIIFQVSKLIFSGDAPVTHLSAGEAYVVVASAYLHDSGMVAAETEKLEIIASPDWKAWVTDGGGAARWRAIRELRSNDRIPQDDVRQYLADLQTRYLIAEFIRSRHSTRASFVIDRYEKELGGFAFDDPSLRATISAVCRGHGLSTFELADSTNYPDLRDIRGYDVDVRFCAILLRLGDLLDLSTDRACLLLLNAASPLPAGTLAHWTKYRRIEHRATSRDSIQLRARCVNQDEHRLLQDWCEWIVDEVRGARSLLAASVRHREWHLPEASMEGPAATISIAAAEGARYVPSQWRFDLDRDEIFQRLIVDAYDSPLACIRELLQNAFDATRCKLYLDLTRAGLPTPPYPTKVESDRRLRYPVSVSLRSARVVNDLSAEGEDRQILSIEDLGIGMDRDVIERFLLQVGRSYYTTEEFRRAFPFTPSSQFGIGFLSVFGLSELVTIETYKPTTASAPIRLTLTGPRGYLLHEIGSRTQGGTTIEIALNTPFEKGQLTSLVRELCLRVEFPIHVDDLGVTTVIEAERPDQVQFDLSDVTERDARIRARHWHMEDSGVESDLYVLTHESSSGERWDLGDWAYSTYLREHPAAALPKFPDSVTCVNGISTAYGSRYTRLHVGVSARVDFRSSLPLTLSRTSPWCPRSR